MEKDKQDWELTDERSFLHNFDVSSSLEEPNNTIRNWNRGLDPRTAVTEALQLLDCSPLFLNKI